MEESRVPNEQRKDALRWVYRVVSGLPDADYDARINALTIEGWEMHTFTKDCALLRRDATGAETDETDRERAQRIAAVRVDAMR